MTRVFREGNQVADELAVMIFSRPLGMYSSTQFRMKFFQKLNNDYSKMT